MWTRDVKQMTTDSTIASMPVKRESPSCLRGWGEVDGHRVSDTSLIIVIKSADPHSRS